MPNDLFARGSPTVGPASIRSRHAAEGLAERVTELGYPYSRSALVNLEYGRKSSIDLGELLVLAAALEVPPMLLLYPDLADGPVEALPGVRTTSFRAALWFGGHRCLLTVVFRQHSSDIFRAVQTQYAQSCGNTQAPSIVFP